MDKQTFLDYIELEVYCGSKSPLKRTYERYFNPVTNAAYIFRKMQYLRSVGGVFNKIRAEFLKRKLVMKYGIVASPDSQIGKGLKFVHPTSVVIGACVHAGENLSLYQNTTLGGARIGDVKKGNQPNIGDNVTVFANSLILGNVQIGSNVTVGANSLVLDDAPDGSVCVGSPARIIKLKVE